MTPRTACPIARRTARSTRRCIAADGLRRRPAPVLPGAAGRRRDVQPVLLLPRRPADVRRPLRLRLRGPPTRDPEMLQILLRRRAPVAATTRRSTSAQDVEVIAMMRVGRILRDYREAGASTPARALGLRGRRRPSSRRPGTSASSIASAGRRRVSHHDAAARRSSIASRRRCASSTSRAASTSTSSSSRPTRSWRRRAPRRSSRRRSRAAPPT